MILQGPGGDGQEDFPSWALSGVLGGQMGKQFVGGKHYPDFPLDMIKFSLSDFYISHESWQNYTSRTFILRGSP